MIGLRARAGQTGDGQRHGECGDSHNVLLCDVLIEADGIDLKDSLCLPTSHRVTLFRQRDSTADVRHIRRSRIPAFLRGTFGQPFSFE
ncbi:MAG: hypothetical protein E7774_03550 [Bradyrhizobium sp.]|nr:MAG: hypothetical protein E7774_03550 [Bradyrhizobium sp.]